MSHQHQPNRSDQIRTHDHSNSGGYRDMSSKKSRRRRQKDGMRRPYMATVTLAPGEVPSDEQLEAEAQALDAESQGKYDLAKKDDLDLTALQHMSNEELA